MPRPERVSNIQALARLNAIEDDDSGNESECENVCEGLDQGSANSEQVRLTWEVIFSNGSDSDTDIDEQTDSASCQRLALAVVALIQVLQHKRRVMSLLQTPWKLDWLLRTEQNRSTSNFLQNRGAGYKLKTCQHKAKSNAI